MEESFHKGAIFLLDVCKVSRFKQVPNKSMHTEKEEKVRGIRGIYPRKKSFPRMPNIGLITQVGTSNHKARPS
jgi:hypothetical protein